MRKRGFRGQLPGYDPLVNWTKVGIGIANLAGGILGAAGTAGLEVGTGGIATGVAIFGAMSSAGLLANGVYDIARGFQDTPDPTTDATVNTFLGGLPTTLVVGAATGMNQSALNAASLANMSANNTVNLSTASGVAGWINTFIQAELFYDPPVPYPQVYTQPVTVSGAAPQVPYDYAPLPDGGGLGPPDENDMDPYADQDDC